MILIKGVFQNQIRRRMHCCTISRRTMSSITRKIRGYLSKVGFNKLESTPQYVKRNCVDILASFAYSMISAYCVIKEEASLLVLFLNGLCMCRIILKNTIESSKMNSKVNAALKQYLDLNVEIVAGKYHYFRKSLVQISVGTVAALCLVAMGFAMNVLVAKALTVLIIFMIFLDDAESSCINLYNAEEEFIIKKS